MFTGIIEATGVIEHTQVSGSNKIFTVKSEISHELKIDQSLSHNGVCLTVVEVGGDSHVVTAVDETLRKTTLGNWRKHDLINLERCMPANGRFDGHIVQGHVDQTGTCINRQENNGSWLFDFEYDAAGGNITVEKGSICVNGVSLTCFDVKEGKFRVAVIPYTFEFTNFRTIDIGTIVNLEFDILGKYIHRILKGYN